jgi:hypothetical protein
VERGIGEPQTVGRSVRRKRRTSVFLREDGILQVKFSEGLFAKQLARSLIQDGGSIIYILLFESSKSSIG